MSIRRKQQKKVSKKLIIVIAITIVTFTVFSIPLVSVLAPLGSVLFPGNGIWRTPGEVPEYETIYVEGLNDEVIVYRDEWGVPHIYAKFEEDLSFATGYVHAQDRLFQMDVIRRQVRGMLSEVVGELGLESDKYNLAMGMEYWAEKSIDELETLEKNTDLDLIDSYERYCDGFNHYIDTHESELPIEYALLGITPKKWTLLDSMCLAKFMGKMLTWDYEDLYNLININALGNQRFNELFNLRNSYQIPICPNYGTFDDNYAALNYMEGEPQPSSSTIKAVLNFLSNVENIESEKELIDSKKKDAIGSNNWVVDGVKSNTGKPILCNDMHLTWTMPGIWYEAHLVDEETGLNTYGFTLPGVPMPLVAHNDKIAWGFTNTGYDVIDWYYYTEIDSDHYVYNGMIKEYETRDYNIPVKGKKAVEFTVKDTVHGPVLNDFLGDAFPDVLDSDKIVIAPRWTGNDISYEALAFYGFNHAKNRIEFNDSSYWFHNPAQNIAYADVLGNIAIRPTGLVPIREGDGIFPYDGSAGEGEWTGYVPFSQLPNEENPDQHYLASANQIVAGPNYTQYNLQNDYSSGYRGRRINEFLNESIDGTVCVETMKELQLDVFSTAAQYFTPYLINAIESYPFTEHNPTIHQARSYLKNWRFNMDKNLVAPTIYYKWRDNFVEQTFEDEFDALEASSNGIPQLNVLEKLMREFPNSSWFDNVKTPFIESRNDIIVEAFKDAINSLIDFYDSEDVSDWKWGKIHKTYFEHLLGLETFSKGPYEADGEAYTVNPTWVDTNKGELRATGGASERVIVDLSDLDNCYSVIPSGQRGITNSRHYSDQLEELFINGEYHQQLFYDAAEDFDKDKIESTLRFLPAKDRPELIVLLSLFIVAGLVIGIVSARWIKTNDIILKIREVALDVPKLTNQHQLFSTVIRLIKNALIFNKKRKV